MEEIKELQRGLTDILIAIGQLQVEVRQIAVMSSKLESTEKLVIQLEQSVKSAHKRIDELEHEIETDKQNTKDDKRWLLGFIPGAVTLLWQFFQYLGNIKS